MHSRMLQRDLSLSFLLRWQVLGFPSKAYVLIGILCCLGEGHEIHLIFRLVYAMIVTVQLGLLLMFLSL